MKKVSKISLLLIGIIVSISCSPANSQVSNLTLDEFISSYQKAENAQLVDLRTDGEWANGVLSSSEKINFRGDNFVQEIEKLDKDKPLYIFCASGGRSAQASSILEEAGFKVFNLKGAGYAQLAEKGL